MGIRRSQSAPILQGISGQATGTDRESVLDELLSSERIYARSMAAIRDIFHTPLLIRSLNIEHQLMSAGEIAAVFRNIREIAAVQQRLLERIEEKAKRWSAGQTLGEALIEWAESAPSAYVQYCTGQERGLTLLARCSASETRLRMFLAHAVSHPQCQGDSLRHLLSLPLQRLSRYIQILSRFVDATPSEHPDHVQMQYALDICERTLDEVAEKMLSASAAEQWDCIQRQLSGSLVERLSRMVSCVDYTSGRRAPFNWLIMHGRLQRAVGESQQRHLFLFRNSLAVCTGDFHQGFCVNQVMAVDRLTSLEPNGPGADPNTITLYRIDSDARLRVVLLGSDSLERWLQAFKMCIAGADEDLDRLGAMTCRSCNAFFTLDMRRILCEHCCYFRCSNCIRPYSESRANSKSAEVLVNLCPVCITDTMDMPYADLALCSDEVKPECASDSEFNALPDDEVREQRLDKAIDPGFDQIAALPSPPNAESQFQQFLQQESRFLNEFSALISMYVNPLITMSCVPKLRLLARDDLHVVFGQTLALFMSHTHLEHELKQSSYSDVENVFARNLWFLRTYTGSLLVSNIERSLNIVNNMIAKRPKLRRFLAACLEQTSEAGRRSLIDLLELPAQRLPSYVALLPEVSLTRSSLVTILSSLVSCFEVLDLSRRTCLARSQIDKIDDKDDLGKFIRKGPLWKQGEEEPLICFLFEKVMLMCKMSTSRPSHTVRKRMDVGRDLVFVNDFIASAGASMPRHSLKPTPLQIVRRRKSMIVHARDERDRVQWVSALRFSIGSARFEDSVTTSTCQCCTGFFTLALRRRLCYNCCEFSCPSCIIIQPESMQSLCRLCHGSVINKTKTSK